MDIILATRNPSKAEQIKAVFHNSKIKIKTLSEYGIHGEAVEDGETLEANALKKARFAYEHGGKGQWIMADDTGFFIEALHGEPGVHAAYWGGMTLTTEERMNYCLKQMQGIKNRKAEFRTTVALVSPSGEEHFFTGEAKGILLEDPRVPPQPKMSYSSLFVADGATKSWAEMTIEEENKISHRGTAFRKVREFLEKRYTVRYEI